MSFSDILKKLFLDGFSSSDINFITAAAAMLVACCVGLYIFVVYRVLTKKTFYSKTFNISLAAITVITAAVIVTIQSNFVVSLGMVGALSIVRFRTAVKDPMDLTFLFWAIVAGIICGVGMALIAIILSLILTAGIVVLDKLPVAKAPMMLVVNASDMDAEKRIMDAVAKYTKYSTVKSRNMTGNALDLIVELRTAAGSDLLRDILQEEGITSASLLSHDGEVTF